MKFLTNLFRKKNRLNFESILIISYGRSGSTLLQGMLNSIDGMLIRGENNNFCFHLYKAYKAILLAKTQKGTSSQNPYFGIEKLDDAYFLNQMREIIRNLLLADNENKQRVNCYGFKEISYLSVSEELLEYLPFLNKVFPNPCFIINTRNKEDVIKSWINIGWCTDDQKEEKSAKLDKTEKAFFDFLKTNEDNTFHITYEDVISKNDKLKALYLFLGAPYFESKIDHVLSLKHSYRPTQERIKELPFKKDTESI